MSDCNVCLYYDGDYAEVFDSKNVRARKEYECCECDRKIVKGELHQICRMLCEGEWASYRTCLVCAEIRRAFSCDGEAIGGVFWDQMDELFGDITVSGDCLKKLTTPEAKRYFAERYRNWKEAHAD